MEKKAKKKKKVSSIKQPTAEEMKATAAVLDRIGSLLHRGIFSGSDCREVIELQQWCAIMLKQVGFDGGVEDGKA